MANTLEQIVRPAQTADIRPSGFLPLQSQPIVPPTNEIVWGASGNNIFQLQAHQASQTKPVEFEEGKRTFDVVRVKNKDDPETFVDVEVMTEYQGRNKLDQSRQTMKFAQTQSSQDSEVISRGNVRTS